MITKRKFIALTLCVFALVASMLVLASCDSGGTPSTPAASGERNNEQTPSTGGDEADKSSEVEGSKASNAEVQTFTISINRETDPLRRRDAHSGWITVDEEILAAIAKDQDFKVKTNDTYKDFDSTQQALSAGEINGIASVSITDEHKQTFDFSQPCFESGGSSYGIAVAKGQNTDFLQMFDAGLSNIKSSGQYQEILDKYEAS